MAAFFCQISTEEIAREEAQVAGQQNAAPPWGEIDFPNVLVPVDSTADTSNTSTGKGIEISVTPSE